MNETLLTEEEEKIRRLNNFVTMSAIAMTVLSLIALIVNLYLLNCSRYLRRPIGVNLRLCVTLTASDALCSIFYILTFSVNIFFSHFSNCASLLLEVFKLTTFTASVFTLLALALNHYVGIVHPLYRNAITHRTVKCTIALAYLAPFTLYFAIFTIFPGGLRAPPAFAFFDADGCKGNRIYRNTAFRISLVTPFIFFVALLSLLYLHILVHMRNVSRDPLLKNNKSKRSNRKLLTTLMLLAGSACVGWLPTSLNFILPMFFEINQNARLFLGVVAQTLHVSKLIADAFIYASRLVEIRYAMWVFNNKVQEAIRQKICCTRNDDNKLRQEMPREFLRYLSETKENRSMRSKRVKSEFAALNQTGSQNRKRFGPEKPRRDQSPNNNNNNNNHSQKSSPKPHRSVQISKSSPYSSREADNVKKNSTSSNIAV